MMTPSFWGVFSQFKRNGATQSSYIFVSGQNGHHNITDILRIKSWIMQILNSRIIYYTILLCQIHIVTCTQSHTQSRTNIVTRTMTRIQSHTQATPPPTHTHTYAKEHTYGVKYTYVPKHQYCKPYANCQNNLSPKLWIAYLVVQLRFNIFNLCLALGSR